MESSLKFNNYQVDNFNFKTNKNFIEKTDNAIEITPAIGYHIEDLGDNNYIVSLSFKVDKVNNDNDIPFEMSIKIDGHFTVENLSDEMLIKQNAISILFPYLRSSVSALTVLANIPIYIIPPINILEFLKESESEGKK